MKISHNKRRNSALLMEFLVRHISKCLIEGNKKEANKALVISKKYFGENSLLKKELCLFGSILNTNVKTKESAYKILGSVCESAFQMNARALDEQKSKLIKEINYTLKSADFYNYKIPNYTVYASIQILLNEARNKNKILNIVDKVRIEENVIEHLTRTEQKANLQEAKLNPSYNDTVYKFLVQRFNKKYEGKINENQKNLLMKYAVYLASANKDQDIKKCIISESIRIKNSLKDIKDADVQKDKDLVAKLSECYEKFNSNKFSEINDENVLEILQFQSLVDEVES